MKKLRRYTNLPVLLDVLSKRELTLLDPASWEDRNDSFYIEKFKELKQLKTVLALCFTTRSETFHHWKVFSDNSSGVCIHFDKTKLLAHVKSINGVVTGFVGYELIKTLKKTPPSLDELPFIKRKPYEDEGEYRIIYTNEIEEMQTRAVNFELDCIEEIKLSPWLPKPIIKTVRKIIKDIPGCSNLKITKTTLIENTVWKNIANGIA